MENEFDIQGVVSALEQEFGNVAWERCGDGNYHFTFNGETQIYVNEQSLMSGSNNAYAYIPGAGGCGNDAALITTAATSGSLGPGIYSLGYSCNDTGDSLDVITRFSECLNQDLETINAYAFSAGARETLYHSNAILEKYPDLDLNLYLIDPFSIDSVDDRQITNLVEHNIPIYVVGPNQQGENYNRISCGPNIREVIKRLVNDNNLNITFFEDKDTHGHTEINKTAIQELLLNNPNLENILEYYTCLIYNSETDTYELGFTSAAANLGDDFSIIMSMEDIFTLRDNASDCSQVLSDISLVMQSVNGISGAMNNNEGLFAPKVGDYSSTASVINGIVSAQNVFFSISNDLHHRVRDELRLITKIAQNYYDMDGDLASLASSLKDANTINFTPEKIYTSLNELVDVQFDSNVTFFKNFQVPIASEVTKIGKVTMSDVDNLMSSSGSLLSNLNAEIDSAKATKAQIDEFSSQIGTNLKGEVWNAVKGNLNVLSDLQTVRINNCEQLKEACTKALKLIKDYMAPDEELDTTKIPELEQKVVDLTNAINDLIAKINEMKEETRSEYDPITKTTSSYTVWVYVYSASDRAAFSAQVQELTSQVSQLKKEIEKLKGFEAIVANATSIINDALQSIYSSYGTRVSDFVSGTVNSYTPKYGGLVANFNYLDFANTIANLYGIPYIDQRDYGAAMSQSGCGWASLAMVMSGLTGILFDPRTLYEMQTGENTYSSTAQREHLGVSSINGEPASKYMELYNMYGITPSKLVINGDENAASTIQNAVMAGAAVIICSNTHYSVIAPGENGNFVHLSSYFTEQNGEYNSVQEILNATGLNAENLNYGAAYTRTDGVMQGNIPTNSYSQTSKYPPKPETKPSSSSGNYNPSYDSSYDAPSNPTITTPKPEIEEPTKPEVEEP
ncbi:MAG: hypothetical protein ACI33S_02115, partial [Bacilli bacterium]